MFARGEHQLVSCSLLPASFIFAAVSVVLLAVALASTPAPSQAHTLSAHKTVQLAAGRLSSGFRWTVDAFNAGGPSGAARPCVSIGLTPPRPELTDPEESDLRCQR